MQTYDMTEELMELEYITKTEGKKVPVPKFFYIERYGRCLEEQMKDILPRMGNKSWFLFKTDGRFREENLLQNFVLELEKYASIGKEYRECILIEFTEDAIQKDGFMELLEYLKRQQESFNFIFTMKDSKNTASIQKCLEQYFFLRRIEAKAYEVEEELEAIRCTCAEYGLTLDGKAEETLRRGLERIAWETGDYVLQRLENGTNKMIYELLWEKTELKREVSAELAGQSLENIGNGIKKKQVIGFRQGGYSYE